MSKVPQFIVQVAVYGLFAVFIGSLSVWPSYKYRSGDVTVVKLSLSHAANRVKPCVTLTPKEIAELAPNMRQAQRCERERLPLSIELDIDGQTLVKLQAPPSGLWSDGPASIYETFEVQPGEHTVTARLRDTARVDGWDFSTTTRATFESGRYFTVTFSAEDGGFSFR
ncbi:MAG: hypothetical protein KJO82_05210 [Gammaproteobacteria bacterium]|nr:hypothetical protein [Gammaproteobacteria bacterium]